MPMPHDIQRKLFQEFSEDLKPLIHKMSIVNIEKAIEPLKRVLTVQA
jgi:hypothetical protein